MEIIGENMHIMNQVFLQAVEERDEKRIIQLAGCQVTAGAGALDINLGQNKKLGRLTPWLVKTIQQRVDVPLLLSSHVLSQQHALEVHSSAATINAVTADPLELEKAMETAKFFRANLVVLLVSSELTPMDVNGRLQLAMRVLETADKTGLPLEQLYFDPVITCRPDPATWSLAAGLPDIDLMLESISMLAELSVKKTKTIVAISNSSVCLAPGKRSAFHCRLLPLLAAAGLDAVIMNCLDKNLMAVAKNPQMPLSAAA